MRVEHGRRLYDICEVGNFPRATGDRAWLDATIENSRRVVSALFAEPAEVRDGVYAPARCEVWLQREFNLRGLPAGKKVRLGIALPIAGEAQREIGVDVVDGGGAAVTVGPGRVDIRFTVPRVPRRASRSRSRSRSSRIIEARASIRTTPSRSSPVTARGSHATKASFA